MVMGMFERRTVFCRVPDRLGFWAGMMGAFQFQCGVVDVEVGG